jgi:HlyD family secretion protein/macrolide-specific efflux system membrane fusion protein
MWRAILLLFLSVALVALGWLARGWWSRPAVSESGALATVAVQRGRLEQTVKARGIIKPAPTALVRVGFPMPKDVARSISHLTVQEGDLVSPGALLARLDHADLEAARQQATAELQVLESRQRALEEQGPLDIRIAEAALAAWKAQRDQARRHYQRKVLLRKDSLVSAQDVEVAHQDLTVAQARCRQAELALQQARAKFRSDGDVLTKQVQQTTALRQSIEVQIRWCVLRSPLTVPAQVFAVHQQQGELTSNVPHAPVLTLLDPRALQAHLYIDEADFGRVRVGLSVRFRVDAHPGRTLTGQIVRLLPRPILQENVVYYLAVVEPSAEHKDLLRAEMTVLAHVGLGGKDGALWLPANALRSRAEGWYVLRPGAGEVPVQIGVRAEGRVEIVAGLNEGDEVLLGP